MDNTNEELSLKDVGIDKTWFSSWMEEGLYPQSTKEQKIEKSIAPTMWWVWGMLMKIKKFRWIINLDEKDNKYIFKQRS